MRGHQAIALAPVEGGRACDTPATLAALRTWCEATGDGGEPSGRAQPCMALTLKAGNGPAPTFRSTANAGAARLQDAAPARVSRTHRPRRARGKRFGYRLSYGWELLAGWARLVSQGVISRLG